MHPDIPTKSRYATLFVLMAGILAIFLGRALLSAHFSVPHTFHLFDALIIAGSLFILSKNHFSLRQGDWYIALCLGTVVGLGMLFATLFSPYPFFGLVGSNLGQAFVRGLFIIIAILGWASKTIQNDGETLRQKTNESSRTDLGIQ